MPTFGSRQDPLGYPWGPFYGLAVLTLQRRERVAAMRWPELAGDLSRWSIPGPKMKGGKPHDVHLSEAARAILRGIGRVEGAISSSAIWASGRTGHAFNTKAVTQRRAEHCY